MKAVEQEIERRLNDYGNDRDWQKMRADEMAAIAAEAVREDAENDCGLIEGRKMAEQRCEGLATALEEVSGAAIDILEVTRKALEAAQAGQKEEGDG